MAETGWKQRLAKLMNTAEDRLDYVMARLSRRVNEVGPKVEPYHSYGTPRQITVQGRAFESYSVTDTQDTDSTWRNLVNMYRRFNSNELPHAHLHITGHGVDQEIIADGEGYYRAKITFPQPLPDSGPWFTYHVQLSDYPDTKEASAVGRVLVPTKRAKFGIISDLDDTIIKTDVQHILKMARNTLLENSRTRLPFAGVAQLYCALQDQMGAFNPIYYISSSPWNLYDLFTDFFVVRGIPMGPLLLNDLNSDYLSKTLRSQHKANAITRVLLTYPTLPFILIGDSGENDPEIYLNAVQNFPNRINAIYIRDVSDQARDSSMQDIIARCAKVGTEMLFVPDTLAAAMHASSKGYIAVQDLDAIRNEMVSDQKPPDGLEALLESVGE